MYFCQLFFKIKAYCMIPYALVLQPFEVPNKLFQQVYILRVGNGHSALYNLNGNEPYEVK